MKIVRLSGLPINMSTLNERNEVYKSQYDAIIAEHGSDMLKVHEALVKLDTKLSEQFGSIDKQELPKSLKAWKSLINNFECPIMIAHSADKKELVLVIMDQQF